MSIFKELSNYNCVFSVDDVYNLLSFIKKYYDDVYLIDDFFIENNCINSIDSGKYLFITDRNYTSVILSNIFTKELNITYTLLIDYLYYFSNSELDYIDYNRNNILYLKHNKSKGRYKNPPIEIDIRKEKINSI